ncbi:hypothetical protein DE146DRAFT_784487 [Phaeosphaeria sp. MPI-PUGE-AT-0046c]|nr:hypothetical protein DE146DRAFT_784487 [Phaeosphaeria sp. MPI-PUGE-AT-0046c]
MPSEWMFNRRNIGPDSSIVMPFDLRQEMGCNDEIGVYDLGNMEHNAGVIIDQNLQYTHGMLDARTECPTGKKVGSRIIALGSLIRHHTIAKQKVRSSTELVMLQGFTDLARKELSRNRDVYMVDETPSADLGTEAALLVEE